MIYFVRRPSDGSIKIGTSIHVEKRLKELIYEYREELSVLAVAEGSYDEEAAYHDRFRHLHVEDEWFGPGEDLLAFVATNASHGSMSLRD